MKHIFVLEPQVANKIAAGEVVDRPASIVKELVENSLDAGATAITVEIRGGGVDYIRITDNGSGIPEEDVPTAFLRHATSKLKTAEELESISSFGFRGEALASIAAVSKVSMRTRTSDGDYFSPELKRSRGNVDRTVYDYSPEISVDENTAETILAVLKEDKK